MFMWGKMTIKLALLEKIIYGRHTFTENGGLLISWNLSGFCVRFRGEWINIHFGKLLSESDNVYVKAEIDGVLWGYGTACTHGTLKINGLSDAEHTLIFRRVGGSVASLEIAAIELDDGAQILKPPPQPSLRMEFMGDSITYGYGLLCERRNVFSGDTDGDGTGTYAYLTASALGADIRTEAISGQGIVCKYDGQRGKPIPEFFEYDDTELTMTHDFCSWVPDFVVINAGTNDSFGGASAEDFCAGVNKLLNRVRTVYPDARIFYVYGIMGDAYVPHLRELIGERAKTDNKLHFVPLEPISEDETGVNAHPNRKGHERAARVLTDAIRAVTGKNQKIYKKFNLL